VPRQITAFSNPLVKDVRALREKKGRRSQGMFMAEGLRILTEAREAGRLPAILFHAAGANHPLLDSLIADVEAAHGDVIETNADILHKLSGKDNPGTVIGVYRAFDTTLARIDRSCRAALDRGAGAEGPGESRHHPPDRRRRGRGRTYPGGRLRRSLLGRGGQGFDGARSSPRPSRRRTGQASCAGCVQEKVS
jgi:hypothetical protein